MKAIKALLLTICFLSLFNFGSFVLKGGDAYAGQGMVPGPGVKGYTVATFPYSVAVVDNFNRTVSPCGGWTSIYNNLNCVTGTTATPSGTDESVVSYGAPANNYGPDAVAYWTVSTLPGNGNYVNFSVRNDGVGSYYSVQYDQITGTGNDTIKLFKSVGGVGPTQIGSTYTFGTDPSAGFSIGLSAIGSTVTAWYKASGGSWASVATATDTNVTAPGQSILDVLANTARLDDFGVGLVGTCSSANAGAFFDLTGAGYTGDAYITGSDNGSYSAAIQFVMPNTWTATGYTVNITTATAGGNVVGQIYTDSSNSVGSAVTGTDVTVNVTGTGIKTFTLSSAKTGIAAGTYWLVFKTSVSTVNLRTKYAFSGGTHRVLQSGSYTDSSGIEASLLGCGGQ